MNDTPKSGQKFVWADKRGKGGQRPPTPVKPNKPAGTAVPRRTEQPPQTAEQRPRTERRPPEKPKAAPPTADERREIAKAVMGTLVERLKTEAQRKGGTLTLADIENLDMEFDKRAAGLEALFTKSFDEYARLFGMPNAKERRRQPFDRLIVETFERQFTGPNGTPVDKGGISRRILPGFFMAVNMMIGPDAAAEFRNRAEQILDRVHDGNPNDLDWRPFLNDTEARELRMDALVTMAIHFANPDKRARWFLNLINNHLSPPSRDPHAEPGWTLSRISYERMIDALFSGLMEMVKSPKGRETLTRRYGAETCNSMITIMKGLGA